MSLKTGPKIPVMSGRSQGDTYLTDENAVLRMMQALVQPNVISMALAAPPASPSNGDMYVVAASAGGAWAGQTNSIAYWSTNNPQAPLGGWEFYTPRVGWQVGNKVDNKIYVYNGTAWAVVSVNNTLVSGQNVAAIPFSANFSMSAADAADTVAQLVPSDALLCYPASTKISVSTPTLMNITQVALARTLPGQLLPIDWTPITFQGGNASPTLAIGVNVSDPINLQIDDGHDYWFFLTADYPQPSYSLDSVSITGSKFFGGYMGDSTFNMIAILQANPTALIQGASSASPGVVLGPNPPPIVPSESYSVWLVEWVVA